MRVLLFQLPVFQRMVSRTFLSLHVKLREKRGHHRITRKAGVKVKR